MLQIVARGFRLANQNGYSKNSTASPDTRRLEQESACRSVAESSNFTMVKLLSKIDPGVVLYFDSPYH